MQDAPEIFQSRDSFDCPRDSHIRGGTLLMEQVIKKMDDSPKKLTFANMMRDEYRICIFVFVNILYACQSFITRGL